MRIALQAYDIFTYNPPRDNGSHTHTLPLTYRAKPKKVSAKGESDVAPSTNAEKARSRGLSCAACPSNTCLYLIAEVLRSQKMKND